MPFLYTGSRASAASSTASACNGARLLRCQHLRSCLLLCRQCAPCYPALQGERQPLVCARTGGFDGCADFWRTARPCPRVPPGIRESIRHFAVQRHCSGAAARKEEPRGKYAPFASAAPWAHRPSWLRRPVRSRPPQVPPRSATPAQRPSNRPPSARTSSSTPAHPWSENPRGAPRP